MISLGIAGTTRAHDYWNCRAHYSDMYHRHWLNQYLGLIVMTHSHQ